jgi:hypothetical protein
MLPFRMVSDRTALLPFSVAAPFPFARPALRNSSAWSASSALYCALLRFSASREILSPALSTPSKLFAENTQGGEYPARIRVLSEVEGPRLFPFLSVGRASSLPPISRASANQNRLTPFFSHLLQTPPHKSFGITSFQKRGEEGHVPSVHRPSVDFVLVDLHSAAGQRPAFGLHGTRNAGHGTRGSRFPKGKRPEACAPGRSQTYES